MLLSVSGTPTHTLDGNSLLSAIYGRSSPQDILAIGISRRVLSGKGLITDRGHTHISKMRRGQPPGRKLPKRGAACIPLLISIVR